MQDHKTNIPHSCRQTLLKFSQEKDKEKKAERNRGSLEKEEKREMSVQEKCQFRICRFVVMLLPMQENMVLWTPDIISEISGELGDSIE